MMCYNPDCKVLSDHGRRLAPPSFWEGYVILSPPEGGVPMVTYAELFQFCALIVGVITLVYQIIKKK